MTSLEPVFSMSQGERSSLSNRQLSRWATEMTSCIGSWPWGRPLALLWPTEKRRQRPLSQTSLLLLATDQFDRKPPTIWLPDNCITTTILSSLYRHFHYVNMVFVGSRDHLHLTSLHHDHHRRWRHHYNCNHHRIPHRYAKYPVMADFGHFNLRQACTIRAWGAKNGVVLMQKRTGGEGSHPINSLKMRGSKPFDR